MPDKIIQWDIDAWNDYVYRQTQDRKTLKRINLLIKDISRSPFEGLGKPEPLKGTLTGFWSRTCVCRRGKGYYTDFLPWALRRLITVTNIPHRPFLFQNKPIGLPFLEVPRYISFLHTL